jgi:hypothetical protein
MVSREVFSQLLRRGPFDGLHSICLTRRHVLSSQVLI